VILGDFDFDDYEEQPLARVLFFVHTTLATILLLSILVAMYVTAMLRAGWCLFDTSVLCVLATPLVVCRLSDTFSLVRGGAQVSTCSTATYSFVTAKDCLLTIEN
jgi:hypothetical protein